MRDLDWTNVITRPFAEIAAGRSHLTENVEQHRRHVEVSNEMALRRGIVSVPHIEISTAVSLARWQTPFQNQQDRGTCYAFAAIAALEAAYRRKYGSSVGLSEQYAFHVNKASELFVDYMTNSLPYENNSSMWGFQGSSDIIDKMARFAVPTRVDCPYLNGSQMTALQAATPGAGTLSTQEEMDALEFSERHIPTAARLACKYRVKDYRALPPNPSVGDIQAVITAGHEVVADIPGHCFLIIGYDIARRVFLVKNSWGENAFITWGFDQPILGGRYILDVHPPAPHKSAYWMGRWNVDHDGWRGTLVIRRWTDYRRGDGDATKLGNYYRDGRRYDVNGLTYDDGQRLAFWVADTTNRIQPGQPTGQPFNSYVFSWDPVNAGGLTRWNDIDFGVTMRRAALPPQPAMNPFDENEWLGNWSMNHDGWKGQLDIRGVRPVRASYQDAGGVVHRASGSVNSDHPHLLDLSIAFGDHVQPFRLALSTWEKQVFAGTTRWAERDFGVQGERHAHFAGWRQFELSRAESVSTDGGMTAVSRIPGSMEVWWIGANGSVQGAFWYEGSRWQRYELAPAGSASRDGGIIAVSRIPGSIEVWWTGANGSVQGAFWYEGSQWQRYQLAPAGSASTEGGIAAVSRIANSMEVWWIGPDGSIKDAFWYEGAQWQQFDLAPAGSASRSGRIAAVSRIPNSMEVWWIGPQGSVEDAFWYEGAQWHRFQLASAGSASTTGGIAAVSRIPNSMEVWWIGPHGSAEDAFWYEGSSWQRFQLAPPGSASSNSGVVAVSRIPNSMEVWWVGTNGSVQDAFWYEGREWQRFELAPEGSAAGKGVIGALSRIPDSMEIWWVGSNGSVHDAFWYA